MSFVSQFTRGHHSDGLPALRANAMVRTRDGESDLTLTPATIDSSHDNRRDKVQGASALFPSYFHTRSSKLLR
ncbi:hypothetical protein CY34DRAFT_810984 [Suillus luteus UH-Slu-Lm8-n1]|uniref:Uncharacterized protein n=1 Tax=Suillus luteus UH-Slu-Lm8-n1 TaxID=930992 RepID=A0A0D0A5A0_9AGAM|nr:hypothetical protein CY34DRAFT_810984 [Suillus luteus UH-Slu-Lm8-n1]